MSELGRLVYSRPIASFQRRRQPEKVYLTLFHVAPFLNTKEVVMHITLRQNFFLFVSYKIALCCPHPPLQKEIMRQQKGKKEYCTLRMDIILTLLGLNVEWFGGSKTQTHILPLRRSTCFHTLFYKETDGKHVHICIITEFFCCLAINY